MVNISGSPDAYSVKDGILTLRMMQPSFDKSGKPTTEGVAATIDMAFEMQYGNVEIRVKANPVSGAVSTFNTMSASGDEIDIEMYDLEHVYELESIPADLQNLLI
jgi:beta-glucanase (GH16 family)